jgi:dTDP-4-amino-4,6-dideoxygalactose transaminase
MKRSLDELAIFGGMPAFEEPLHVGRPNIGNRKDFLNRVNDVLDRRWLSNNGPLVEELERRIAGTVEARHCIATCNATIGLELTVRAFDLKGSVIVPAFAFIASAHVLQWSGITPIFCDIEPKTHNLDPARVEALITSDTTGILAVHLWGRPCKVEALTDIARQHGLKLIFDAAHAFGCAYRGTMIGNFGDAEVFSFHATKFINSFEGGAVVTNDDALASKIRLLRNFGFADYDNVTLLGTNGKMSEVSAAMGLTSLDSMAEFIAVNRRNHELYAREFKRIPGIRLIEYDTRDASNFQYAIAEIDEAVAGIGRDALQRTLWAENVLARRYFYPGCHRMEPYRSSPRYADAFLPATEALVRRVLCLPSGQTVTGDDISSICEIIRLVVTNAAEMRRRLAGGVAS